MTTDETTLVEFPGSLEDLLRGQEASRLDGSVVSESKTRASGTDLAIINTANAPWRVVPDTSLRALCPPERTAEFFFSPKGHPCQTPAVGDWPVTDCGRNLDRLLAELARHNPAVIYLRTSPHTQSEFLASHLHEQHGKARILHEFYDMSALFSDGFLRRHSGYDDEACRAARLGTYHAARHGQLLIGKVGGAQWEKLVGAIPADAVTFFPLPDNDPPEVSAKVEVPVDRPLRLAFAGSMTAWEILRPGEGVPGANFLRFFEAATAAGTAEVTIFNAAHRTGEQDSDARFQPLMERYGAATGPIRYYRALDQDRLLAAFADFDLGLCCSHYPEDRVEPLSRSVMANRFAGYLAAGLPVIVDNRFEFMADLITRFEAGIVIAPEAMADLPDRLRTQSLSALRAGATRLRDHLSAQNRDTLRIIGRALTLPPERGAPS